MSTIDIAPEMLAEALPILALACTVVGSERGPEGVVRLIVEGPPEGHHTATITKVRGERITTVTVEFKPEVVAARPPPPPHQDPIWKSC